ncbi:MAG TPA: hypothetical protein VKZ67_14475 [Natronosporangium sp.]|nr:hypothetical protein [Natronosporangium sp.]
MGIRAVASRRERAARVAAATHVSGDPKGASEREVQQEWARGGVSDHPRSVG